MIGTLKVVRNLLGTVGLIFAGYVFLEGLIDSKRYVRISTM
jgi:hypothetical protein